MGNANQMIVSKEKLYDLIPQRPPMVMIDALLKAEEKEFETTLTIREDNLFVDNNYFIEAGLVENIAQTSAAGSGQQYLNRNKAIPIGFIAALQNLKIFHLPRVGDCLKTSIILVHKIMNISIVKGTIYNQDKIAAQCDMKLYLQD